MNIKDFLIDNYIWILVIILITIITIIGFLADKKKGNNKEKDISQVNPNLNNQIANNGVPMQYQQTEQLQQNPLNNNMGMNYNNMNIQPQQPINQNMIMNNNSNMMNVNNVTPMVTEPQPVPMGPTSPTPINNPQPVENVIPNIEQEPIYQPLSEQKPVIPPQPVPNFNNMQKTDTTPLVMDNVMNQNTPNVVLAPQVNQPLPQPNQFNQGTMMTQVPTYNVAPVVPTENNNQGMVSNANNTTVPQPIPVPQQVVPQPIMQQQYNGQQMMQPNYQQPMQGMTQNMQEQPSATSPLPINFVYGPQNNNQNM